APVSALGVADTRADSPLYRASKLTIRHRRKRGGISTATAGRRLSLTHARSDGPRSRKTLRADASGPGSRRPFPQSTEIPPAKSDGRSIARRPHGRNGLRSVPDPRRPKV